jgi:stage IV sporulation protein FB
MDGGRVLRGVLGLWLSYPAATRIAATVGQVMAVLMGLLGLLGNLMLLVIAFFIWQGAAVEAAAVRERHASGH